MSVSSQRSSTFARNFRTFLRWMRDNGIDYSDGLAFELGGSGSVADIGVRALYPMQTNELIAAIPKQACLTVKTTGAAQLIEEEKIGGGLGLTVAIMYERSLQEGSRWYGYLQVLPHEQNVPFLWSTGEIDSLLLGTELHKVIKEDRILMQEDWKESILPLSLHHAKDFPANWFTLDHYLAAKTLVGSRAFEVDEYHGFGMVPLADLFNHKTAGEDVHFTRVESDSESDSGSDSAETSKISQSENHVNAVISQMNLEDTDQNELHHQTEESSDVSSSAWEGTSELLEMILVKDVAEGSEIFNTYGSLGNAALLHRYGFTELDNPFDIVNIDLALVLDASLESFSSRHIRRRTSEWRRIGCAPCTSQSCEYFEISVVGKPQEDLLMLLLFIHLSDEDFDSLSILENLRDEGVECIARALGWAGPLQQAGSLTPSTKRARQSKLLVSNNQNLDLGSWLLMAPVAKSMLQLLERRDGLYPTASLEEDLAQLSTTSRSEQPQQFHALTLRTSERSILKRCQMIVAQSLAALMNEHSDREQNDI